MNEKQMLNIPGRDQNSMTDLPAGLAPPGAHSPEWAATRCDIIQILWRHRGAATLTFLLCIAVAMIYMIKATPIYRSSSQILAEQRGPRIIATTEGVLGQSKNYLFTQCELLKSTPILSGAVDALEGRTMRTFEGNTPVGFLKRNVRIRAGKNDDIITIALSSPYPAEAAEIVNSIVESYISYHSRRKRSTAAEVLKILQREKIKQDKELQERVHSLMDFKRANETISFGTDDSNIIIQRLIKLSNALTDAELELSDTRWLYKTTKTMLADPDVAQYVVAAGQGDKSVSSSQELTVFDKEMSKLQMELTSLKQSCTSEHPLVQEVESKLAELASQRKHSMTRLGQLKVAVLEQQTSAAKGRVTELLEVLQRQRVLAQKLNAQAAEYAMLDIELKRTERMCDILDTRIKEIDITDDTDALNISIVEFAVAAGEPYKPNRARIMASAIVLGLMLGAGVSLLRNWQDHRLRTAEEASEVLGLPLLGVVPHISLGKGSTNIARIVEQEPSSHAAEAYRTIRTGLYFGVPSGEAKTVLVTSPAPSDGKTSLVSNLAIAIAQTEQKVLILDADFRKPSQHESFEIDKTEVGLCGVLTGKHSLNEAIRSTDIDNLDLLPCGTIPPNPSEILNSRAFRDLLEELSKRYDHILLDAPPIMSMADARILGAISDITLLVIRAQKSSRKPSRQAAEELAKVGAKILGIVFNDAPTGRGRYYSHDNYYYYNSYGYGKRGRKDINQVKEEQGKSKADAA